MPWDSSKDMLAIFKALLKKHSGAQMINKHVNFLQWWAHKNEFESLIETEPAAVQMSQTKQIFQSNTLFSANFIFICYNLSTAAK